jgi:hypothetical protein
MAEDHRLDQRAPNLVRDHVVARLFGAPVKWEKG